MADFWREIQILAGKSTNSNTNTNTNIFILKRDPLRSMGELESDHDGPIVTNGPTWCLQLFTYINI